MANLALIMLLVVATTTTGLPTLDVGASITTLRPVDFEPNNDTPLGGHATGLSNVINGPKSPLSLFGKDDKGKLKFKPPSKRKKKLSPTPVRTPKSSPSPQPSENSKTGERDNATRRTNTEKTNNKNNERAKKTNNDSSIGTGKVNSNHKKKSDSEKSESTISDEDLKRLKDEAIQRELKKYKEELRREKKKRRELARKIKRKNKKGKGKAKKKGERDYKCTPGKKMCAKGFWCVGEKGDMVCRRPKAPYESCRSVRERCQIGSVCRRGICLVKYKNKADKAEKARREIFQPKAASSFKRKTAGDILGH